MTTRRRLLAPLLVLLTALLYVLAGAAPASAHTELVRSTPKDGTELGKAPAHLTLTFDEPVELPDVRVMTLDGDRLPVSRAPRGAPTPCGPRSPRWLRRPVNSLSPGPSSTRRTGMRPPAG